MALLDLKGSGKAGAVVLDARRVGYQGTLQRVNSGDVTAERVRLRTRPPLWRELLAGLCVFGVYVLVAALPESGRRAIADRNALTLLAFEQWLHIDVEKALNTWLVAHPILVVVANYEYAYVYVISAFGLVFWLYFRHPNEYPVARDSFIVLNLLAIVCFALFPLTPPRLLPELGYLDTVVVGTTFGSWGSPLISHANELAAMPSLHVAWALWVSAILARGRHAIALQVAAAVHVAVTVVVIAATATHFVADAIPAVPLVWLSVVLAVRLRGPADSEPVPAADAFFLHVETDAAPQHVGGMAVLAPSGPSTPTLDQIRAIVRDEVPNMPRFCQRLSASSTWRRWRWVPVDAAEMDWDWHVSERVVVPDGGVDTVDVASAVLSSVVAELAAAPLPRDRPMWRIVLVREISPRRCGLLLLVHHCVADGMGVVAHALHIVRPRIEVPTGRNPPRGAVRTALATAKGLAQLATDGTAPAKLGVGSPARQFATTVLDLDAVRSLAHDHRATVTEVLLTLVGTAVDQTHPAFAEALGQRLRVAVPVPVMLDEPGSTLSGNVTGAVMIDLPLGGLDPASRLADIRGRSARLRTPTRALASRFVMARLLELLPIPLQRWFARSVYGAPFLQAIVSNMAGPPIPTFISDVTLDRVVPILPLAPGAPLAVGALSWTGELGIGVAVDSGLLNADWLAAGIIQAAEALSVAKA
ncbi:bifunctional phosphatase PAP2/O-acyltransferase family protein [Candidatus Mycolicibacterium alkanivorans]|uniref:Phosphatase PAP2 family protein n=1 Tax=Candidatus Mycolicibacterium alkanivorans TaxID=2954114 RepID=A0ABS9YV58_9MYCO|nr:phosphatase PAP2 family protein [Candidatus Mycolicibacterium alkanivorans]MCI4674993.1 phosphatase PAP2 family protein [Candidatus Mycolicibacterium alkanivorans]